MNVEVDRRAFHQQVACHRAGSKRQASADEGFHVLSQARRSAAATSAIEGAAPARRVNAYTQTSAYLDAPEAASPAVTGGSLLERAVAHVLTCLPELDPEHLTPVEFTADPHIVETRSGERIVYLQQHVFGVPVFRALRTVRFDREGRVLDVVGDHVPCRSEEVDLVATLDAAAAVQTAARHLAAPGGHADEGVPGLKPSNRRPTVLGTFPLPSAPTLVRKLPFASPILAHRVLFYQRPTLRLGWYLPLRLPELIEQFDVIVAANGDDAGAILFCRDGMACGARARATLFNPDLAPAELFDLPQPLAAFPPFSPRTLPGPWLGAQEKGTAGNNVVASVGNSSKPVRGLVVGGDLHLDPAEARSQAAVNAFFLCNYAHDFFYLLGFDEQAGALQKSNPTGHSGAKDELEVSVRAFVPGDAKVEIQSDGFKVRMSLGPITSAVDHQTRHTAFDAEVVMHEYTHAVTARRVGGCGLWKPLGGGPQQAQAMEEGLSDYFALTLQIFLRRRRGLPESLVYGAWSSGDPLHGRRPFSYDGFNRPFDSLPTFPDPHEAGMIWCAALLGIHHHFAQVLGDVERGDLAGWLLVYEALPAIPMGPDCPSFLDGRDALLRTVESWRESIPAIEAGPIGTPDEVALLEPAVRQAFADLGMGRNAQSQSGTFFDLSNDFQP